jgi:hypothetical protein
MFNLDKSNDNKYFLVFLSIKRMLCGHPLPLARKPKSVSGAFYRRDLIHILSGLVCFVMGYSGKHPKNGKGPENSESKRTKSERAVFHFFPLHYFLRTILPRKKWKGRKR